MSSSTLLLRPVKGSDVVACFYSLTYAMSVLMVALTRVGVGVSCMHSCPIRCKPPRTGRVPFHSLSGIHVEVLGMGAGRVGQPLMRRGKCAAAGVIEPFPVAVAGVCHRGHHALHHALHHAAMHTALPPSGAASVCPYSSIHHSFGNGRFAQPILNSTGAPPTLHVRRPCTLCTPARCVGSSVLLGLFCYPSPCNALA